MKKVVVTGGRYYSDSVMVFDVLDFLRPDILFQGGANGADLLAKEWAGDFDCEVVTVEANWDKHGKAAGPIRNGEMLDKAGSDAIVIAFPGGKGTENCIKQAKERNMIVLRVEE